MRQPGYASHWNFAATMALVSVLVACSTPVHTPAPVVSATPNPTAGPTVAPPPAPPMVAKPVQTSKHSNARSAREYRVDAARHLYALNTQRIYSGKLPPLIYAVGVLNVELDARGNVRALDWMRAPSHAPEVVAEIERTVRAAAPFPMADKLGSVVYTDVWLWDESGHFQLDTLTEGQLGNEDS